MDTIAIAIGKLTVGEPADYENVTVFPLIDGGDAQPDYLVLDQALARDAARVSETSESGTVPELRFENLGDDAVLLLDGEELVGAKQNRVLNLTILAPARSSIRIPVSCVEAGRWAWRSRHFESAGRAQFAALRAKKMLHVSESLARRGSREARQGEVWSDIGDKFARMEARSASSAMSDLFDQFKDRVDRYVEDFAPEARQVGAVFAVNGKIRGMEFFDAPATFERQARKIMRSYALDAIEEDGAGHAPVSVADAHALVDGVGDAASTRYPALGLGEDVRFGADGLDGGALVVDGRVVHLCAFTRDSG